MSSEPSGRISFAEALEPAVNALANIATQYLLFEDPPGELAEEYSRNSRALNALQVLVKEAEELVGEGSLDGKHALATVAVRSRPASVGDLLASLAAGFDPNADPQ